MNKPDWKDAPEWAVWLAQDADGEWWWYQMRPHKVFEHIWYAGGRAAAICKDQRSHKWENTLEARP